MYIFSFFKSLFKPKHILPSIYFFLNAAIIFFIFYILPIEITADAFMNSIYLGLIGLGVNLFFIVVSLTPFGELLWRVRNGIKIQPESDLFNAWLAAENVFLEVREAAAKFSRGVNDKVRLYYSPTDDINAFALGHRTVIITRGMLVACRDLRGVFAHELGHIAHGDSDLKLGINVANSILTIFVTIVTMIAAFIVEVLRSNRGGLLDALGSLLDVLFYIVVLGLFKLWTIIGVLCVNWSSKKQEYHADDFAKEIGYGEQLQTFLREFDESTTKTNWFNLMWQTHPDTIDRLEKLAA